MSAVFITATGTDVGKTYIACALIAALRGEGREVDAFKPVLSGYNRFEESDAGLLLAALGQGERELDRMSPLRFAHPLAPPSAARAEGETIELSDLIERCEERIEAADYGLLLIEGAGGLMSPLAEDATNLDLIQALGVPSILVAGSYLGSVSHTLTALAVMGAQGLAVAAVVVNQSDGAQHPPFSEMTDALARFAPSVPVVVVRRHEAQMAQALSPLI